MLKLLLNPLNRGSSHPNFPIRIYKYSKDFNRQIKSIPFHFYTDSSTLQTKKNCCGKSGRSLDVGLSGCQLVNR